MADTVMTQYDIYKILRKKWKEIRIMNERDSLKFCMRMLDHTEKGHDMRNWPISMVRSYLRTGPNGCMRGSDVRRAIIFFIGNRISLLCLGVWMLSRVSTSNSETKDQTARLETRRMMRHYNMVLRHISHLQYYDLVDKTYVNLR